MGSPKSTPLVVAPHRKSHLKSETYRTLVRILSHCYDHPSSQFVPPQAGNDGEPVELSNGGSVERNDSLDQNRVVVDENFKAVFGLQERGFSETQMVIDEIENLMRIEGDEDLSKEKELVVNDASCGTGLQDRGLVQAQQLLMYELEHVMKADGEVVCVNNDDLVTMSSDGNRWDDGTVVVVSNNQEEQFRFQPIGMEECRGPGYQLADAELAGNSEQTLGTSGLQLQQRPVELEKSACTSGNGDQQLLNELLADNGEGGSLMRTQGLEAHRQMQEKERELEKLVSISGTMGFFRHTIEDGEMEEGEVSGEFELDGGSVDMLCEDAVVSQEKKVDAQKVFEDVNDQNTFHFNEKNRANKKDSIFATFKLDAIDNVNNRSELEAKECIPVEMECKRKVVIYEDPFLAEEASCKKQKRVRGTIKQKEGSLAKEQQKSGAIKEQKKGNVTKGGVSGPAACPNELSSLAEKSDQMAFGSQGITSNEKDAGLSNKKKRGHPSKEKKAKKKKRERKKRAEKNRELGVKRLKLRPVSNPKPVAYCRHFLNGRCQEGDNCKFSHDTIPLTKSKPCCHFARQSCMKGENCPFDHQLSKYPCTNFVSKGSCSRGENCLFSHKLPPKEDLPSLPNVCTPVIKPTSLPGISNSKNQTDRASPGSTGLVYDQNTEKNMEKFVQNQPGVMPKGISFLSGGNSSTVEPSHPEPSVSSVKSNDNINVGNQTGRCAVVTIKNCNEIPKGNSLVAAPRGINFLSFAKAPPDKGSSDVKLMSSAINQGNAVKLPPSSDNFSVHKEVTSSSNKDNSIQVGREANRRVANMPRLNEMLQRTELAVSAFGDALKDSSRRNEQVSLPLRLGNSVGTSVETSKIASDKQEDSNEIKWKLPSSSVASGQSSDKSSLACLKNTPISAQKALISTLAFAAKVESQMTQNPYTPGALAVSSSVIKENGASTMPTGSQIDSSKATKILDFLSSIRGLNKEVNR